MFTDLRNEAVERNLSAQVNRQLSQITPKIPSNFVEHKR